MGIGSKLAGFLKESWEGIMSPGPVDKPKTFHRAGFGSLYYTLTGNNIPGASDSKPSLPVLKK